MPQPLPAHPVTTALDPAATKVAAPSAAPSAAGARPLGPAVPTRAADRAGHGDGAGGRQGTAATWAPGTRLRVDLQLCRALQRGHWTAELSVPGVPGRLSFPSLRALGHYIARLEAASADGAGEPDASERRREGPRP